MRTTVTLDPDVERLLQDAIHRTRKSFKKVLNEAIRAGLRSNASVAAEPFTIEAKPMGLRAGIDSANLSLLGDEMEVEAFLANASQLNERLNDPS